MALSRLSRTRLSCRRALLFLALAALALPAGAGTLEETVGRAMARAMRAQYGVVDVPLLHDWVAELGAQVVANSPRSHLPYSFTVLDSPEANAFALPGGYIFVTAGLLERARGDDEVAGVLAHEAAHLAHRDFQRVLTRVLLFYALGAVLRHNDQTTLDQITSAVAMLNLLDHSRKCEAQADAGGVELAVDAGYDPAGLNAFLDDTNAPAWSYLETMFSTHPHPARRVAWISERVARIEAENPARMIAVAESLAGRGRCVAAREMLTRISPPGELNLQRLTLLGEVALARGDRAGAIEHFRAVLAQAPSHQRAAAGLAAAEELVEPAPVDWPGLSPQCIADLAVAREQIKDRAAVASQADRRAWRHLRLLWDSHDLNRALEMAQVYDPEVTDPAYLALLAQTWDLMAQVMRGANLVGRALNLRREVTSGLVDLTERAPQAVPRTPGGGQVLVSVADELSADGPDLAARVCEATASLEGVAADYEHAGRQVAPLFLQLLMAGDGDPWGRLVFSRFAVLQAQVAFARMQVNRAHRRALSAAGVQWQADATVRRMSLNLLGAGGSPLPALQVRLAARRLRSDEATVQARWAQAGGLGDAAHALACESLGLELAPAPEFSPRLRALGIVLRMLTVEIEAEQD